MNYTIVSVGENDMQSYAKSFLGNVHGNVYELGTFYSHLYEISGGKHVLRCKYSLATMSPIFHRFVILCICLDTPCEITGL